MRRSKVAVRVTHSRCGPPSQVIRVKNYAGTRLPVTACSYSPDAKHIVAGGEVRAWRGVHRCACALRCNDVRCVLSR
jgi:hypothetical protein